MHAAGCPDEEALDDFMSESMDDLSFLMPDGQKPVVAMAYVPWQHFTKMYENLEKGYQAGTIFPELDKPFTGRRCVK